MKQAIAVAALALLAAAFALEGAFYAALAVPQMGEAPVLATGAARSRALSGADGPSAGAKTACATAAGDGC